MPNHETRGRPAGRRTASQQGQPQPPSTDAITPPRPSRTRRRSTSTHHYLTDPAIQEAIDAFVATAPPLPEDVRSRLARLLRTNRCGADFDSDEPGQHAA